MAESPESGNGYVACTQCNGDGVGCELSQVPELLEDCSTMQVLKAGSAVELAQDDGNIQPPDLPFDWQQRKDAA